MKFLRIRPIFVILSLLLLASSIPECIKMMLEANYKEDMRQMYETKKIDILTKQNYQKGDTNVTFTYHGHKIRIALTNIHGKEKKSEFSFVRLADINIYINDKKVDTLKNRIIEKQYAEENYDLSSIHNDLNIFQLIDKQQRKEKLVIIVDVSNFKLEEDDYRGYFKMMSLEDSKFHVFLINNSNKIESQSFDYDNRTKLQTYLTQKISMVKFGHYTNSLDGYASIIFPFLYPFFTLFLGLCLLPFVLRSKTKNE